MRNSVSVEQIQDEPRRSRIKKRWDLFLSLFNFVMIEVRSSVFEFGESELRARLDGKMAKPLQTSTADPLNANEQDKPRRSRHFNRVSKPLF